MNLLFLCTHNACRSILAEAITRKLAGDRLGVSSAGSHPAGTVHPSTLQYLRKYNYPTEDLISTGWGSVSELSPDIVITVCDQVMDERCPTWLGNVIKVHWGLPDPTQLDDKVQEEALFSSIISTLERRIQYLLQQNFEEMTREQIKTIFQEAGKRHGIL
ncbi:arsenate reductase ArsC [Microbulbifer sp. GL-2]|uniref:arsenate reductase ArsC n=1 Tax=Microbulbifer sp. GL-2 TaxID=2591606 RepID=UPI001161F4F5|nr:arsenate reductase ArsC [Microbulbifer sp. GL-2]BBM03530.1 protein-tyrosine-phosphatase [Microbulbifer sp. GL-2]